jgi:hypothetical protein
MNDIVFGQLARPGCVKVEAPDRGVGITIELRGLAFGGDEVRPVQKLNRLLQF